MIRNYNYYVNLLNETTNTNDRNLIQAFVYNGDERDMKAMLKVLEAASDQLKEKLMAGLA